MAKSARMKQRIKEILFIEMGEERADGSTGIGIFHQAKSSFLQRGKSKKEESHTKEEITDDAPFLHISEDYANEESRIDEIADIE